MPFSHALITELYVLKKQAVNMMKGHMLSTTTTMPQSPKRTKQQTTYLTTPLLQVKSANDIKLCSELPISHGKIAASPKSTDDRDGIPMHLNQQEILESYQVMKWSICCQLNIGSACNDSPIRRPWTWVRLAAWFRQNHETMSPRKSSNWVYTRPFKQNKNIKSNQ